MRKINKDMMEFHKPSELCQVLFIDGTVKQKKVIFNMDRTHIDLINIIFYKIKEYILTKELILETEGSSVYEFYMVDFTKLLNKYKKRQYL